MIVLTERFLEILKKRYSGKKIKFSVIPCAVDTERFKSKTKDNALLSRLGIQSKIVIAYVGSLGTWYMFSEMIDFFKSAINLDKNVHFLILTQTDKRYAIDLMKKKDLDAGYATVRTVAH